MKKIFLVLFIAIFTLSSTSIFAQTQSSEKRKLIPVSLTPEQQKLYQELLEAQKAKTNSLQSNEMKRIDLNLSKEDRQILFNERTQKGKKYSIPPSLKRTLPTINSETIEKKKQTLQSELTTLPSNIRFAGEFEESQAVLVSIPSVSLFKLGEYKGTTYNVWIPVYATSEILAITNIPPGKGLGIFIPYVFGLSDDPNEAYAVSVIWAVDLALFQDQDGIRDSTNAKIWTNLINNIQQECTAWIRIANILDSTRVKTYMQEVGIPLTNYEFFGDVNGEDAYWARDWGPLGIYYGTNNTLGFMDAVYYTGRAFDDEFPKIIFNQKGYNYYNLPVKMEGGNIMGDGYKYITYSDVIYQNNTNEVGQLFYDEMSGKWMTKQFTTLDKTAVDAKLKKAFNAEDAIVTKRLLYDGGTGHIDLWLKQIDEESMLIANMPAKYNKLTDYKIIQQNREMLANRNTAFGTKYRFLNAPMPRLDNGEMPSSNDSLYNLDPRSYLNGVIVNKSYIYPIFSKPGEANYNYEMDNKKILEKLLPGYKLCPIDCRALSPLGGAVHCITMQIPAANPITIRHKPIRDQVTLSNSFDIEAELISKKDANNIALYWRKSNETNWNMQELTIEGEKYKGKIEGNFEATDTVQYYLAARRSTTIKKCHPITAPAGYHTFYFGNTSIDQLYNFTPTNSAIESIYPNPATDKINIIFEVNTASNIDIEIFNNIGQLVQIPVKNKYFNKGVFTIDINNLDLPNGNYFIKMSSIVGTSISSFVIMNK